MTLADEVHTVREKVAARLRELEPLVREYEELKQIAREIGLDEVSAAEPPSPAAAAPAVRRSARRRSRRSASDDAGDADAARGELSERVLEAIRSEPGHSVAEYARMMGVAPTVLYRPVRELTKSGVLVKRARQLFPA